MSDARTEIMGRSGNTTGCHSVRNELVQVRIRWVCPTCGESFRFHPHDIDVMDFFAARHLVRKHNMDAAEAAAYATQLRQALAEREADLQERLVSNDGEDANHPQG